MTYQPTKATIDTGDLKPDENDLGHARKWLAGRDGVERLGYIGAATTNLDFYAEPDRLARQLRRLRAMVVVNDEISAAEVEPSIERSFHAEDEACAQ